AIRRVPVPTGLQARIRSELRKGASPDWRYWLAAAAMITLMVGVWGAVRLWRAPETLSQPSQAGAQILRVGLDDHVRCAIEHRFAERRFSEEEIASALGPQYVGLVSLVEQAAPGEYLVTVGHRCRANRREYVHLILKSDRASLSLVITRKNGESFERGEVPSALNASGVPLYRSSLEGYEVAGLETRDYLAFVVSDLAAGENLRVASTFAAGVRDFLARLEA
ncbi:MAG TPA: hypothetical protein VNO14_18890, partial [Blastocatellia bacterium]|nr:hypothetical protein [Blastocatellia bacterium]